MLPGNDFGEFGEGFVRICYAVGQNEINDAMQRIKISINKLNV